MFHDRRLDPPLRARRDFGGLTLGRAEPSQQIERIAARDHGGAILPGGMEIERRIRQAGQPDQQSNR